MPLIVTKHPGGPYVVKVILLQDKPVDQPEITEVHQAERAVGTEAVLVVEQVSQAHLDPFRCDGSCRVDVLPAPALNPDFGPGLGIILTHRDEVFGRMDFATQVTTHYAGRIAGRAHEKGKTAGKMLAETPLRFPQKLVN